MLGGRAKGQRWQMHAAGVACDGPVGLLPPIRPVRGWACPVHSQTSAMWAHRPLSLLRLTQGPLGMGQGPRADGHADDGGAAVIT